MNDSFYLIPWLGPAHTTQFVWYDPGEVYRGIVGGPFGWCRGDWSVRERVNGGSWSHWCRGCGPHRKLRCWGWFISKRSHVPRLSVLAEPTGGHLDKENAMRLIMCSARLSKRCFHQTTTGQCQALQGVVHYLFCGTVGQFISVVIQIQCTISRVFFVVFVHRIGQWTVLMLIFLRYWWYGMWFGWGGGGRMRKWIGLNRARRN